MKVGNEVRIYNYMENVFRTVASYYDYEEIKAFVLDEENTIEDRIREYYLNNIKNGFRKYFCFEGREACFLALNINSYYQDAEMISMNYRILEELKLDNIIVYIKASRDYDLKRLLEYLEQLDVDYEISDTGGLLDDNTLVAYEIVMEIKDKKIVLASGNKNIGDIGTVICFNYLDNILKVLNVLYDEDSFNALTQVTIVGESEEERIVGMKLAQDLRWCEIIVDVDTDNRSKDEQLKGTNSNFIVVIENENLKKGLIKVIDNVTQEETMVDENEIIDYIVSNI